MFPNCCPICYNANIKTHRARALFSIKDRVFELPFPTWYFECEDCGYKWDPGVAVDQKDQAKQNILKDVDADGEVDFY